MQTNADLDQKHCFFPSKYADLRFADCDTKELGGFAICYYKLADLRFVDWHNSEICGFAIAE
jgi:hypothetical protein